MDLTKIVVHILGNAQNFFQMTRQVMSASTNMANHVVAQVQRIAGSMGSFGAGANWGGGGGFGGFASSILRGAFHGGVAGAGAAVVLGPMVMAARAASNVIDTVISKTWEAVRATVRLGAEYERIRTSFEVFAGRGRGEPLLGQIQQLGIQTPYTAGELATHGQTLLGYGVNADSLIPALSRLGDIAGGDPNRLRRLTLAFGQVLSHGRFMGQEARQFAEAGVGASDFAKTMGISGSEFKSLMAEGMVGPDVMFKTINRLTSEGGRFFEMNKQQLKTVQGAWNSLNETVSIFLAKIGYGAFERLGVAEGLNRIRDSLGDMDQMAGKVVDWIGRLASGLRPFVDDLKVAKDVFGEILTGSGKGMSAEDFGKKIASGLREATILSLELAEGLRIAYIRMQMMWEAVPSREDIRNTRFGRTMDWLSEKLYGPHVESKAEFGKGSITGGSRDPWASSFGLPSDHPLAIAEREAIARQSGIRSRFDPELQARIRSGGSGQPTRYQLIQGMINEQNAARARTAVNPEIPIPYSPSPYALEAMRLGSGRRGALPYTNFVNMLGGINEAFPVQGARFAAMAAQGMGTVQPQYMNMNRDILEQIIMPGGELGGIHRRSRRELMDPTHMLSGAQLGGLGPMAGMMIQAGIPALEERNKYATFQAFQQLAHAIGNQLEVRLPPALARGTSEAQDVINRSAVEQVSELQQIRAILEAAAANERDMKTYMELLWLEISNQRGDGKLITGGAIGPGGGK